MSLLKNFSLLRRINIFVLPLLILLVVYSVDSTIFSLQNSEVPIKNLSWITGHWVDNPDSIKTEEIWLEPSGGMILGLHRDILGENKAFFEYLRIEEAKGEIIYYASPQGRKAVGFKLVNHEAELAEFENQENDFPKRIIYKLLDKKLHVKIDGGKDNSSESLKWVWQKIDN